MDQKSVTPTGLPAQLLRTRDIRVLWLLRMLSCARQDIDIGINSRHFLHVFGKLKINVQLADSDSKKMREMSSDFTQMLSDMLERLEARAKVMKLPKIMQDNLDFLHRQFSFNKTECLILALAISLRIDNALFEAACNTKRSVNMPESLEQILGIPASSIARALEPGSRLRRSNLIDSPTSGDNLGANLRLRRGGLRKLGLQKIQCVDEILDGILTVSPKPTLLPEDYIHLDPGISTLQRYLADALQRKRTGVNILLHGLPGTGKSELVRVLAQQLRVPVFNVADTDEDYEALGPDDRLSRAVTGLFLIGDRRAIVCFDEVGAIFNDGSIIFGKPSTAESRKSFFNHMLEKNQAPVFWIANSIRGIDPAFARRFDLVIQLKTPPQAQRLSLLERECNELVPRTQLKKLSRIEHITPAMVTRAASVVRRTGLDEPKSEKLLETVLDGVLQAQHHPPISASLRGVDDGEFIPDLCNTSVNLQKLAEGLSRNMMGRICLYGPPGTGKSAFGRWLADQLDKPLVLKRVSDLQSPYVGEMEQNLAKAFATAKRDGAILQIDEVDTFLQDRRQAQRTWEISQVNEFLTQLEIFDGLFIASTNLMDGLDHAALRRFDFKVRMDYLRPDQALAMLERHLKAWGITNTGSAASRLRMQSLTPGDFAVVARRHQISPFTSLDSVLNAICEEAAFRAPARTIGFIGT